MFATHSLSFSHMDIYIYDYDPLCRFAPKHFFPIKHFSHRKIYAIAMSVWCLYGRRVFILVIFVTAALLSFHFNSFCSLVAAVV